MDTDYNLIFLRILPMSLGKKYVEFTGHKKYFLGKYLTHWNLKKIFSFFSIIQLTPIILKNPQKFSFTKLYKVSGFTKHIPIFFLQFFEPFYPDFIWILEKNLTKK